MAVIYKRVLANGIIDEREGRGWTFDGNDKDVLKQMCDEISETFPNHPYKYHYLVEIDMIPLPAGASSILLKYLHQFESEACRAVLMRSILIDDVKIKGMDRIFMDLYYHFKASKYYIPLPKEISGINSSDIYSKYDLAFSRLKSSKILPELLELMKSRRDVDILPGTARMIAKKWAPKELGEVMANYLLNKNVTRADVGLPEEGVYYPSLETIVLNTSVTAVACLQYYPSEENLKIIMEYTNHPHKGFAKFAKETVEKMATKLLLMKENN